MPHKPKKTRIGSKRWSEQKARDKLRYQEQQEQQQAQGGPKPKPKPKPNYTQPPDPRQSTQSEPRQSESKQSEPRQSKQSTQSTQSQSRPLYRPVMTPIRLMHLRILGLTAGQDNLMSIKKAYRALALKHHPDRGVSNGEAMKLVNAANDFLNEQP